MKQRKMRRKAKDGDSVNLSDESLTLKGAYSTYD